MLGIQKWKVHSLKLALLWGGLAIACVNRTQSTKEEVSQVAPTAPKELETLALDVNDVSFLFPPAKTLKDVNSLLKLSDKTSSNAELFPKFIFDAHINEATGPNMDIPIFGGGASAQIYGSYRIFGVRLVPCADSIASGSITSEQDYINKKCAIQLRLVAQPYENEGDPETLGTDPADHAIHLVYNFPGKPQNDLLKSMIKDLSEIKKLAASEGGVTNFVPLGVHPAIKNTGLESSKTLKAISQFVLKHADVKTMSHVAMFITEGSINTVWHFFMSEIDANNKSKPIKRIVPLFDKSNHQSLDQQMHLNDKQFAPKLNLLNTLKFVKGFKDGTVTNLPSQKAKVESLIKQDLPLAYEISDPSRTPIAQVVNGAVGLKTDCFSCHLATPVIRSIAAAKQGIARGEKDFFPDAIGTSLDVFELPTEGRIEHELSGTTPFLVGSNLTQGVGYAFRNFGLSNFQGKQIITISEYAVHESVMSANLMNAVSKLTGPAILKETCRLGGANRRKLEECIYQGGGMACYAKFDCR